MNGDGVQGKLSRVQPPKVHITFDLEKPDGAVEKVELPFLVGAMADLSNKPIVNEEGDRIPVRSRKFKDIDRDSFGAVMAATAPEANVRVDNKLDDSGGKIGAKLVFQSMDDFRPENIARKVPALKPLLEIREMLQYLKDKIDGNDKLEKELQGIVAKTIEAAAKLGRAQQTGPEGGNDDATNS